MVNAADALERLKQGNARFVSGSTTLNPLTSCARRGEAVDGQQPIAVILGCADSRVPVEMIFDQDLGKLFVIRVAGHVVAPSQIGSVEFAAEKFGAKLVVVLGHSQCGAVRATVEELRQSSMNQSPHLKAIVERIRPAVEPLLRENPDDDIDALVAKAVPANVRYAAAELRHGSGIIERRINQNGLLIVGAEYSLATGIVEFFETGPDTPG